MSILVIDNYDSFTYNLVHLVEKLTHEKVVVVLNDQIEIDEVAGYSKIILSPGPGIPDEAGNQPQLIKTYAGKIPMLGVCLGHQAIAQSFGAKLVNLHEVYHGLSTTMHVSTSDPLFDDIPEKFPAGRYHSWVVETPLPSGFTALAHDDNGYNMAYVNREKKLYGVQFHPESILTPVGETLIKNWLNAVK